MKWKQVIPAWVVGVVIILALGTTIYSVIQTQTALGWRASNIESPKSIGQIFFPGVAALQETFSGMTAAPPAPPAPLANQANGIQVPTLLAGATPMHADRGECTACHTVLSKRGMPIPRIQVNSKPPHDNRGLCTNCHIVVNATGQPQGMAAAMEGTPAAQVNAMAVAMQSNGIPVAMPAAGPGPGIPMGAQMATPMAAPMPQAGEGGWNGVEVAPITQLTATQFGIPLGTQGLVVSEAEAAGAVAGLKAGDVITAVNGVATPDLTAFFQATNNGMLARGTVTGLRKGQPLTLLVDVNGGPPNAGAMAGNPQAPQTPMAPSGAAAMQANALAAAGIPVALINGTPVAMPVPNQGLTTDQLVALAVPMGGPGGMGAAGAGGPGAAKAPPPEGEWLGLEVAPISSLTARQYNLPPGLPGLVVVEAEAQAAGIGVRAGDVLQTVNGVPITDMTIFFLATKNGTAPKGTIGLWRKGEQIVARLSMAPPTQPGMAMGVPQALQTPPQPLQAPPQQYAAAPGVPQPVQAAAPQATAGPANQINLFFSGMPWQMPAPAGLPASVPSPANGYGFGGDVLGYGMGLAGSQSPSVSAPFPRQF
jgi:S1-C subfamily serine protease